MNREFENTLKFWKENGMKKPMMVIGARQIGKTYTIDKFCHENFENVITINLEKEYNITNIFERTLNPLEIIRDIEIRLETSINPNNTVIFFDEVQVSEKFISSLKYFCEDGRYKIICAGSLLGVKLNRFQSSFPVGKIQIEYMYPMNFCEFLEACGNSKLVSVIQQHFESRTLMDADLHEKALLFYKYYLIVGGMPESIQNFIDSGCSIVDFHRDYLKTIVDMYLSDMSKYTLNSSESVKIEKVYRSIPKQLSKENHKFQYKFVEEKGNSRKFSSSIEWLFASSIVLPCFQVNKIEIPLNAFLLEDVFKVYFNDVGILNRICEIGINEIINDTSFMFRGAITENYVAEELYSKGISLLFWKSKGIAEVDFLLSTDDGIIPIEVKSSDRVQSKSLNFYMEKYKPKYGIRLSTKNFGFENNIFSIPLYAVFCIKKQR